MMKNYQEIKTFLVVMKNKEESILGIEEKIEEHYKERTVPQIGNFFFLTNDLAFEDEKF